MSYFRFIICFHYVQHDNQSPLFTESFVFSSLVTLSTSVMYITEFLSGHPFLNNQKFVAVEPENFSHCFVKLHDPLFAFLNIYLRKSSQHKLSSQFAGALKVLHIQNTWI
jgi:hypothetical protein